MRKQRAFKDLLPNRKSTKSPSGPATAPTKSPSCPQSKAGRIRPHSHFPQTTRTSSCQTEHRRQDRLKISRQSSVLDCSGTTLPSSVFLRRLHASTREIGSYPTSVFSAYSVVYLSFSAFSLWPSAMAQARLKIDLAQPPVILTLFTTSRCNDERQRRRSTTKA